MRFQFKGKEYSLPTHLKDVRFDQFIQWQQNDFGAAEAEKEDYMEWSKRAVEFLHNLTGISLQEIEYEMVYREVRVYAATSRQALLDSYNRIEPDHHFELAGKHYTTLWPNLDGAKFQEHLNMIEIRRHFANWVTYNDWMQLCRAMGLLIHADGEPIGYEEVIRLPADKVCSIFKSMEDGAIAYGYLARTEGYHNLPAE